MLFITIFTENDLKVEIILLFHYRWSVFIFTFIVWCVQSGGKTFMGDGGGIDSCFGRWRTKPWKVQLGYANSMWMRVAGGIRELHPRNLSLCMFMRKENICKMQYDLNRNTLSNLLHTLWAHLKYTTVQMIADVRYICHLSCATVWHGPPPGGRAILVRVLPPVWNIRAFSRIPLFSMALSSSSA